MKPRGGNMRHALGLFALGLLTLAASAEWVPADPAIPAFHNAPPGKAAPHLLPESEWRGPYFSHGYQTTAYRMAGAVSDVLYQQPCFCWCSKAMGHKSLHSCFEGSHGAVCATCMKEAAYTYRQTRLGRTPAEIRAGIVKGEWNDVDLTAIHTD
ncbi:MAG: CYCXC family (seleno)protein [Janthinobacterium lividum]